MSTPTVSMLLTGLLLAVSFVFVATPDSPPTPPADGRESATAVPGVVVGTVDVGGGADRRTANRYRGRGAARAAREVQDLAPVVFIEGPVPGGAPAPAGRHVLMQRDTAFTPSVVGVQVGETVEFPNDDDFFHNVFSYSGPKRFDLGRYPRGETRSVVFDEPGVVQIFCEVHEHMRAVVVVTRSPHHAVVEDDGSFVLAGVPAGTHRVVAWHPDAGRDERTVDVRDGATTNISFELD